jgi:hypothetical protein
LPEKFALMRLCCIGRLLVLSSVLNTLAFK